MGKSVMPLAALILIVFACSSSSWGYVATFDDVPVGQDLSYYLQLYGLSMAYGWHVVDSAASGWGTPHSGTQSVVWNGNSSGGAFGFGVDGVSEHSVRSVGAYFTTQPGVLLQLSDLDGRFAASIGSTEGWTNRYVQIGSYPFDIRSAFIVGISSPDAIYHFSMDDLTIVPVPEPSSLLALLAGIGGFGALLRRRRR